MNLNKLLFWRRPKGVVGNSFTYTVPKGEWHVQETHSFNPNGSGHSVVILTQKTAQTKQPQNHSKKGGEDE